MPRTKAIDDKGFLEAALEGLELQKQRIEEQIREVRSRLGAGRRSTAGAKTVGAPRRRRRLSAEARERIAAAQKKRWEAFRKKSPGRKAAAKKVTDNP